MPLVYLSIATLTKNETSLENAIEAVSGLITPSRISLVHRSPVQGYKSQSEQLVTLCLEGETDLSPQCLLVSLANLQSRIGRKYGRRLPIEEIAIDLLFYDQIELTYGNHTIPLANIESKEHILKPLSQIAPHFTHPGSHLRIEQLLLSLSARENSTIA